MTVLFALGADLESKDRFGRTSLLLVCGGAARNDTMLKCLIQLGAQVDVTDRHGFSALRAAGFRRTTAMELLLQAGAPTSSPGITQPLYEAVEGGAIGPVEVLLKWGADPFHRNRHSGKTAYQLAFGLKNKDILAAFIDASA